MIPRLPPTAVVLGATGLVGGYLVSELTTSGVAVTVAGRRPLPGHHDPALSFHLLDFEGLRADPSTGTDLFAGDPAVFVALGTTRKAAGSKEAFRRVDLEYVRAVGQAARAAGVSHLLAVSSVGASVTARNFYLQVKGEAEEALDALDFPSLTLARPSLLLGHRTTPRPLERWSGALMGSLRPVLKGPFTRYRPIHARTVARALVQAARDPATGTAVLESHHLARLGG